MPRLRGRACLAALPAVLAEHHKQELYRIYTTDALQLLGESVAAQMAGRYLSQRYADLINPPKQETRTAEEIIDHMKDVLRRCAE